MIAFPTNHALMPHVDSNGLLVSRALVVHPPRRRNRQIPSLHPCIGAFSPILSETQPEFLHFALTWPGFDSRTRDSFATSPTEPSVVHICTITSPSLLRRSTLHHNRTPAIRISCNHQCARDIPCQRPWPISHTNTQRPCQESTTVLFNTVVLGSMS